MVVSKKVELHMIIYPVLPYVDEKAGIIGKLTSDVATIITIARFISMKTVLDDT